MGQGLNQELVARIDLENNPLMGQGLNLELVARHGLGKKITSWVTDSVQGIRL